MGPLGAFPVLAGQLLGAAFAAGLNLYATVAVLGSAARLGLVPPLPPGLRGLSNLLVIGSAAGLFLGELIIEKLPVVGAFWAGGHTLIRPVATALLAFLAISGQPLEVRLPLAIATGLIAFAAHGAQTGLRIILVSSSRPRSAVYMAAAALTLDIVAITIALVALLDPTAATTIAVAACLVLVLAGPRLWRAAVFGGFALVARITGFFGRRDWKSGTDLPRYVQLAAAPAPLGSRPPRATRAAAIALPRTAAYRTGWLIFDADGPGFIYRTLIATRRVPLPPAHQVELRPGTMMDALRATGDDRSFTLFLLKDGPPAVLAAAELAPDH